jgi:hypothetical protein
MTDEKVLAAKQRRKDELEQGNLRSYQELRATVMQHFNRDPDMDTSDMRRELLIEHLIKLGIFTEEQALDFEIEFHTRVEEKLGEFWAEVNNRIAEAKKPKLSVVKKGGVLLDKHGHAIGGGPEPT